MLSVEGDDVTIGIVNPDGSRAEMSGNGTRIAGAWLMSRTGSTEARVHVGPRTVAVRRTEDGLYESELGAVEVGQPELVDGVELTPVSVGNPHAVVAGDPSRIGELGPRLETHPRFPERTNVQVARVDGPGEVTARVWERGVGETSASGAARSRSQRRRTARRSLAHVLRAHCRRAAWLTDRPRARSSPKRHAPGSRIVAGGRGATPPSSGS